MKNKHSRNYMTFLIGGIILVSIFFLVLTAVSSPVTTTTRDVTSGNTVTTEINQTCTSIIISGICQIGTPDLVTQQPIERPHIPTSEKVELLVLASTIDNDGKVITSTSKTSFDILLSLLRFDITTQQGSSSPFDKGKVQLAMTIKTEKPNSDVTTIGKLFVRFNGINIHPSGIDFSGAGLTNATNLLPIKFTTPLGVINKYTYSMLQNPVINGSNTLQFFIKDLQISKVGQEVTSLPEQKIFQVNIERDPNRIIVKDASGNYTKVYVSDGKFTLCGIEKSYTLVFGTIRWYVTGNTMLKYPPPTIGTAYAKIIRSDGFEKIVGSTKHVGGTTCISLTNIPRFEDVRLQVLPNSTKTAYTALDRLVRTPVDVQKTYTWTCNGDYIDWVYVKNGDFATATRLKSEGYNEPILTNIYSGWYYAGKKIAGSCIFN